MKLRNVVFVSLVAALGAGTLAGCASEPNQRRVGQVIDDSTLTARVKTALAKETTIGQAMNVNVNTYRGTVQLSGFVESQETARRAGEIARSVEGVRAVENDLRVRQ